MEEKQEIHKLIADGEIILVAGVYDALSAKLAEQAGFHTVVITGFGVAASLIGEPDFGLLTQSEIIDTARRVCNAVSIPVVVDGDTGYGGALNVMRTVRELIRIGARGTLLEDQVWPKRCGHMRGKEVVPMEEHCQKIRAAVEAKGENMFFITARTDARAPLGLKEAIKRGNAYKEAGADLIFIEAPETVEELREIGKSIPHPLVVNMIEGGRTPLLPLAELRDLGFISVGYVLSGLFAAAKAIKETYLELLARGTTMHMLDRLMPFDEFTRVVGLEEKYLLDEKFRGKKE
jgi:methylisocitrate lyase